MIETVCPHCGAKTIAYWHRITPGLVHTLVKVYEKVCEKNENLVHKDELDLDHSEYGNFQKLRFHALIAKYRVDGIWQRGTWVVTKRGAQFLKNQLAIPKSVKTFRNKVVAHSDETVDVGRVMKSDQYWDMYEDFKGRGEGIFLFEPDLSVEDVQKVKKTKKKKGKKYCPNCEAQLKIAYIFKAGALKDNGKGEIVETESTTVSKIYQCTGCNYSETIS